MPVQVKSYSSPSLILLAFDWPAADQRNDFVGFGIERTPAFRGQPNTPLSDRIGVAEPAPDRCDLPAQVGPIRKCYWWDSGIGADDRGASFHYRVVPMVGPAEAYEFLYHEAGQIDVQVP